MADKAHRYYESSIISFYYPGCKYEHAVNVDSAKGTAWGWNNSLEKPTFTPSILVWQSRPEARCHSFVTDGKIQFLADCFHELKNQTVELPDWA